MKIVHVVSLGAIALGALHWFSDGRVPPAIQAELGSSTTATRFKADLFKAASAGRDVSPAGTAQTETERFQSESNVDGLQGGGDLASPIDVIPPDLSAVPTNPVPYRLSVSFTATGAVIEGLVPGDATRTALLQVAIDRYGAANVVDHLQIEPNIHPQWRPVIGPITNAVAELPEIGVQFTDTQVVVTGRAESALQRDEALARIRSAIPYGVSLRSEVTALLSVAARQCQTSFERLLDSEPISFVGNSSTIFRSSHGLLDRLIAAALQCPETRIEIAGHTDSDGTAANNLRLSQERAAAILNYLSAGGVAGWRLAAVGYGERLPIAKKDSAAGRSRNGRIELIVKGD